jgi:uncharacterized Ntn-hydrolase superfamily protein
MRNALLLILTPLSFGLSAFGQNLPSPVLNRNINSTFSIVGYDPEAKEWGIAVATNNIYVGNSTCYVQPGVGAFSVIAETEPAYGLNGLEQLRQGRSVEDAINFTRTRDTLADYRQVSGIDSHGNIYAFTGSTLRYWKGVSTSLAGKYCVAMGNQLAKGVLEAMTNTFGHTGGTLAERLLKSLMAGEKAGGQITGKQSAALVVKGTDNEWFNQIDLRVDHSRKPFEELERLLNFHYGRIMINQAVYAIRMNNTVRGRQLLEQAGKQVTGWYGMYSNLAKAYLLLGDRDTAIRLIKTAVAAEPKWKENLSAFYCLYDDPYIRSLYPESRFSIIDWNNAISMYNDLNRSGEATTLAQEILKSNPSSSYTWYLLAKARQQQGDRKGAREANESALKADPENADAGRLAKELGKE